MRSELAYKTYILRVWQVDRDDLPEMVAALEDCQTDEHHMFPSLAALAAFLEHGGATPLPAADRPQPPDGSTT